MITQEELKSLLNYNPETGMFVWAAKRQKIQIGSIAGTPSKGYISIGINYKAYSAHKLAWLYVYGVWPTEIDHINHVKTDNRIKNLRETTRSQNQKNQPLRKKSKSGVSGVIWGRARGKWIAQVNVNGVTVGLGSYADKFEAICARMSANNKYGYHENHGN